MHPNDTDWPGSANDTQGIKEIGRGSDRVYATDSWNGISKPTFLLQSDSKSGVGATSHNKLARLYVRNSTTGRLAQWALSWGDDRFGWIQSKSAVSSALDLH